MPTDTFPIAAEADDASGGRDGTAAGGWGNITTVAYNDFTDTEDYLSLGKSHYGGDYFVSCSVYLRFDTSSIPADATITAANLLLYVKAKVDGTDDVEFAADFYDFGGEPSVLADWEISSSGNAITSIDPDSVTVSVVNTFALTGLTGIMRSGEVNGEGNTGITGIRLAALDSAAPTVENLLTFGGFEEAFQEARLEVTYTSPAQVLQASADSVDGNWTDQSGGSSLFAAIDEDVASDSDYIRSELSPQSSGCRVKLEAGGDPAVSTGHEINWRIAKDTAAGQTVNMTVKLYQGGGNSLGGGTLIADFDRNAVSNTFTDYAETLSGAEADAITDYTDLYLEFWADVP